MLHSIEIVFLSTRLGNSDRTDKHMFHLRYFALAKRLAGIAIGGGMVLNFHLKWKPIWLLWRMLMNRLTGGWLCPTTVSGGPQAEPQCSNKHGGAVVKGKFVLIYCLKLLIILYPSYWQWSRSQWRPATSWCVKGKYKNVI